MKAFFLQQKTNPFCPLITQRAPTSEVRGDNMSPVPEKFHSHSTEKPLKYVGVYVPKTVPTARLFASSQGQPIDEFEYAVRQERNCTFGTT